MVTLTRAGWGARPPKARQELNPARVTDLFLHHTTGTYTDWKAATRSIQAFHMTTRGWNDIAYNWLVAPDGTKIEGRGFMTVGGHTKGHNSTGVAVAYLGDGRLPVSDDAKRSIIELADAADEIFERKLNAPVPFGCGCYGLSRCGAACLVADEPCPEQAGCAGVEAVVGVGLGLVPSA
jgi:hypothetical protein